MFVIRLSLSLSLLPLSFSSPLSLSRSRSLSLSFSLSLSLSSLYHRRQEPGQLWHAPLPPLGAAHRPHPRRLRAAARGSWGTRPLVKGTGQSNRSVPHGFSPVRRSKFPGLAPETSGSASASPGGAAGALPAIAGDLCAHASGRWGTPPPARAAAKRGVFQFWRTKMEKCNDCPGVVFFRGTQ